MAARGRSIRMLCGLTALLATMVVVFASPSGANVTPNLTSKVTPKSTQLTHLGVGTYPNFAAVRTTDGVLHLIYPTSNTGVSKGGLSAVTIAPSGKIGTAVIALPNTWETTEPGLTLLSNGTLLGVFGAISPPPDSVSSFWSIESSDGGATWSSPVDVSSKSPVEAQSYGANMTAQTSGGTPVVTLSVAGNVVAQQGLGLNTPTTEFVSDGSSGDVDTAVDAKTGAVFASWDSLQGTGGDWLQRIVPTVGPREKIPVGPGQQKNEEVISGRDEGPGVFGAYAASKTGTVVRVFSYGGGSIAVGSLKGVRAAALGTATGPDGRIWVMWGQGGGPIAVTRSNKAVTRWEPIQRLNLKPFSLYRLSGDGRLGPLDLFVDEIPPSGKDPGTFYSRVLPVLSASVTIQKVKNKNGKVISHHVTVVVKDAGDVVSGAKVHIAGHMGSTNAKGTAIVTLPASVSGHHTLTVTRPGYRALSRSVKV